MADSKVSALTAAASALAADEFPVNEAGTSKKVTLTQVGTLFQTLGMSRAYKLASDHAISSVTGTSAGFPTATLEAGTYTFDYYLLLQSATLTVSPLVGVNFTGTATATMWFDYADLSGTLLAAIGTMSDTGTTAVGFAMRMSHSTFTTTSPNMGDSSGATNRVQTINKNFLVKITGLLIVTVSGNLELWHSSQTATSTTVKAGSSLVVIRTA